MPALLRLRSSVPPLPRAPPSAIPTVRTTTAPWTRWRYTAQRAQSRCYAQQPHQPTLGTTTPVEDESARPPIKSPFYFEAGYACFAKRPSRPFPPPFLSLPSTSFSEPLSTHNRALDRRPKVNGAMIRGVTNGDDAVLVSEYFIGANDGVGAWATRERGHAALWSRLILHFWSLEVENAPFSVKDPPKAIQYLQTAFEKTKAATSEPNEWHGTTTAVGALLSASEKDEPLLYVTQIGDGQILVIRPSTREVMFRTEEQWHWFDCPRQLGTNSPDTPEQNGVLDTIPIREDDVVIAMTDGVVDNLWEHEVVTNVCESLEKWRAEGTKEATGQEVGESGKDDQEQSYADGMRFVAQQLVNAAREIAEDPFAESPYMEKAIDEGLSIEGGKLDDISVVAAQCKRRKG